MFTQEKKITVSLSISISIYHAISDAYTKEGMVDVLGRPVNFSAYVSHLIHMGIVYKKIIAEKEAEEIHKTTKKKKKG